MEANSESQWEPTFKSKYKTDTRANLEKQERDNSPMGQPLTNGTGEPVEK